MSGIEDIAADVFGQAVPLVVEREPEGVSTVVYRITRGEEQFFMRLAEDDDDNLEVDALVHERLAALGVRTPAVVHVTRYDPRAARSLMITKHIGGRPLTAATDLSVRLAVLERAGEQIALINSVPVNGYSWVTRDVPTWPPAAEIPDYPSYVVADLPTPWPGDFEHLFTSEDLGLIENLIANEQRRSIEGAVLAHGDLGLDHIFELDGTYAGIIDFGEIRGTEPEFDLGVFANHSPREDRAALIDAMLTGYGRVAPLPDDIRHSMHAAGTLKVLRQLGRWLRPDFPHQRDPAALATIIGRRLLPPLRTRHVQSERETPPLVRHDEQRRGRRAVSSAVAPDGSPVELYLRLDGAAEARFIDAHIPQGSDVLELGAGAGRVTRHLVQAGHRVTAVDNCAEMLAELEDIDRVERVLADIETLDLRPRRWSLVLLGSHLINDPQGPQLLASAAAHVAPDGMILVQRHEPGWIDRVGPYTSERPGLTISMVNISRPAAGVMSATMVFDIDGHRFEQRFTAEERDDDAIAGLAMAVGCVVTEVVGSTRKWIKVRPAEA